MKKSKDCIDLKMVVLMMGISKIIWEMVKENWGYLTVIII